MQAFREYPGSQLLPLAKCQWLGSSPDAALGLLLCPLRETNVAFANRPFKRKISETQVESQEKSLDFGARICLAHDVSNEQASPAVDCPLIC
jgi:hypothetical protein